MAGGRWGLSPLRLHTSYPCVHTLCSQVITGIFVAEIGLKVAAWGWWRGDHAFLKPAAALEPSPSDQQHDASLRDTIT